MRGHQPFVRSVIWAAVALLSVAGVSYLVWAGVSYLDRPYYRHDFAWMQSRAVGPGWEVHSTWAVLDEEENWYVLDIPRNHTVRIDTPTPGQRDGLMPFVVARKTTVEMSTGRKVEFTPQPNTLIWIRAEGTNAETTLAPGAVERLAERSATADYRMHRSEIERVLGISFSSASGNNRDPVGVTRVGPGLAAPEAADPGEPHEAVAIAIRYLHENRPEWAASVVGEPVVEESQQAWRVTWNLPEGTLGGSPVVHVDRRTRKVTEAYHTQ